VGDADDSPLLEQVVELDGNVLGDLVRPSCLMQRIDDSCGPQGSRLRLAQDCDDGVRPGRSVT